MSLESPDTLPESGRSGASAAHSATNNAYPRRFGPYVLLQRIGRGGMGDVSLAKQSGVAGIEKLCVVKRIRAKYTADREYVQRFIDEARTVVMLTHRNVCQVFDVGSVEGAYYLAMELVPGRDLRAVQDRAAEYAIPIPVPVTLHICGDILEALDYAHRLTNPATDEPLGVVHRDVSPHNVILSFEGEVKLIDFGLAASTMKLEQTEPGIVIGKLQYMAPEQARGEVVDRRTDVFAVGVLLYELLVGERYYEGLSTDAIWTATMKGAGAFRPRKLAGIKPALRALIERATASVPRDRFTSAAAFRQALRDVQLDERLLSSSAEARAFMEQIFPGDAGDDRKERARLATLPVRDIAGVETESVRIAAAPGPSSVSQSRSVGSGFTGASAPISGSSRVRMLSPDQPPMVATRPSTVPDAALNADDNTVPMPRAPGPAAHEATEAMPRARRGPVEAAPLPVPSRAPVGIIALGAVLVVALAVLGVMLYRAYAPVPVAPIAAPVAPVVAVPVVAAPVVATPATAPVTPEPDDAIPAEPLVPAHTAPHPTHHAAKAPPVPLPPVPTTNDKREEWLEANCRARVSCANVLARELPTVGGQMTLEATKAYWERVDACVVACSRESPPTP